MAKKILFAFYQQDPGTCWLVFSMCYIINNKVRNLTLKNIILPSHPTLELFNNSKSTHYIEIL